MKIQKLLAKRKQRRRYRVGNRVRRDLHGRPRLSIFKSNRHMYAQIIDDTLGVTLAAASTLEPAVCGAGKPASTLGMAQAVGRLIGERAASKGIHLVAFDRGPFRYHGRVAALADAAREQGLQF